MKFLVLGLFFFIGAAVAQTDTSSSMITKVIDLNYIKADVLVSQINPLLHEGESVSGTGNTLILNVSKDTLTRIRPIIHKLDSPPVVFEVSVHQGDDSWLQDNAQSTTVYSATSRTESGNAQAVRVMSGEKAYVSMGSDRPIVSSVSAGWAPGVSYQQKRESQGFFIEPTLEGQQVKIKINRVRDQANRVNEQSSDNQSMGTTTMIPLNKWIKLSSTGAEDINSQPASTTYSANNAYHNDTNLFIMVRIVK